MIIVVFAEFILCMLNLKLLFLLNLFLSFIKTQFSKIIKTIHTNNDSEFILKYFYMTNVIHHQTYYVDTPLQNDIV